MNSVVLWNTEPHPPAYSIPNRLVAWFYYRVESQAELVRRIARPVGGEATIRRGWKATLFDAPFKVSAELDLLRPSAGARRNAGGKAV